MGQIIEIESRLKPGNLGQIFQTPATVYAVNFARETQTSGLSFQLEPAKPNPEFERFHIQSTEDRLLWSIYAITCTDKRRQSMPDAWKTVKLHDQIEAIRAIWALLPHVSPRDQEKLHTYFRGWRRPKSPQQHIALQA